MCGRFTLKTLPKELEKRYDVRFKVGKYKPSYNIAPSKAIPVLPNDKPDEIIWMRWGMTPSWWRQKGRSLINVRQESLTTKHVFKKLVNQRCLIPANGFYEWKKIGSKKVPYYFMLKDDDVFSFAGLWDKEENGKSSAILTCEPNSIVAKIHDRMPCILKKEDEEKWLSEELDEVTLSKLLKPFPVSKMMAYEVGLAVNSPVSDDEQLIERVS